MSLEDLNYKDKLIYMQGVITKVTSGGVELDFKGRLGSMSIPKRMIISDYELKEGLTVGFMMSYPEVESDVLDTCYVKKVNSKGGEK